MALLQFVFSFLHERVLGCIYVYSEKLLTPNGFRGVPEPAQWFPPQCQVPPDGQKSLSFSPGLQPHHSHVGLFIIFLIIVSTITVRSFIYMSASFTSGCQTALADRPELPPILPVVTSLCHRVAFQGFQLPEIMAVVILICGCCPGGALSNILALAIKGDMNLRYAHCACAKLRRLKLKCTLEQSLLWAQ